MIDAAAAYYCLAENSWQGLPSHVTTELELAGSCTFRPRCDQKQACHALGILCLLWQELAPSYSSERSCHAAGAPGPVYAAPAAYRSTRVRLMLMPTLYCPRLAQD